MFACLSVEDLHGSVVKFMTYNGEAGGSYHTVSSGMSYGLNTSEPQVSTGKSKEWWIGEQTIAIKWLN